MVCNIHLFLNFWKCKVQEELIYFICHNILGRGKEVYNKRGEGKGNLVQRRPRFMDDTHRKETYKFMEVPQFHLVSFRNAMLYAPCAMRVLTWSGSTFLWMSPGLSPKSSIRYYDCLTLFYELFHLPDKASMIVSNRLFWQGRTRPLVARRPYPCNGTVR